MSTRPRPSAKLLLTAIAMVALTACSDDGGTGKDAAVADGPTVDRSSADLRLTDSSPTDSATDLSSDAAPEVDGPRADAAESDAATTKDAQAADSLAADTRSPDLPTSGCNAAKIAFTQANPQMYEIYEFCFEAGATLTETQAKVIDPGLLCVHSAGGAFAKCASGKWRCSGILVRGPTGALVQASWDTVCLISQLPKIDSIVGGHYL